MASVILGIFSTFLLLAAAVLPSGLSALGLHPDSPAPDLQLPGYRAVIITTSQGVMPETGMQTGVWASEMTGPYYTFQDAGLEVDFASIKGGVIPIDSGSLQWPWASQTDQRYLKDPHAQFKRRHSYAVSELNLSHYDLIFIAGGWGAAYDLGQSKILGERLSQSLAQGIVHGAVCHGPLGFLQATNAQGEPVVKGLRLTAVSNQQIFELGIGHTPLHPEQALRQAGANYVKQGAWLDILATHVAVDGQIVTGQNQNSALETANTMLQMLKSSHQAPNRMLKQHK